MTGQWNFCVLVTIIRACQWSAIPGRPSWGHQILTLWWGTWIHSLSFVSNNLFQLLSWRLTKFLFFILNTKFTTGWENRMRLSFVPSESWFVRSCHISIPACLFASLVKHWSCIQYSVFVHSLDKYSLSCVNAPCPCHLLLTPRRKGEKTDEQGKSQPGLRFLNFVSICVLAFTLYGIHFYPRKGKSIIYALYLLAGGEKILPNFSFLLSSQPHSSILLWLTRTGFWSNK